MELTRADGGALRILVVDDEPNIAELVGMALRYEGWETWLAHSGRVAVEQAREFRPDAVVLDVMLPDFDGLEVLRRIRGTEPDLPVLFLTAKDAVEDRVAGLTAGGDDYVNKPFSLEELVARLRSIMRRTASARTPSSARLVVGDLELDEDSREVLRGGEEITLTACSPSGSRRSKNLTSAGRITGRVEPNSDDVTTTLSTYAHLWPTAEDKTRTAAPGMAAAVLASSPHQERTRSTPS